MAIQRVALLGSERSLPANASQVGIPNPHDLGPLVENGVCAAGEPVHQEPSDGQMRKEFFDIGTAVWIAQR